MTQETKEILIILIVLAALCISASARSDEPVKTTGHIDVTVVDEPEAKIETPVEYLPVCKPDHMDDTCRHSWDDMHPWKVEPVAGTPSK